MKGARAPAPHGGQTDFADFENGSVVGHMEARGCVCIGSQITSSQSVIRTNLRSIHKSRNILLNL